MTTDGAKYQILMLSSSRFEGCPYLEYARPLIGSHLGHVQEVVFIPYAGVTLGWDAYTEKVQRALPSLTIRGLHTYDDPITAIRRAESIAVGGGNTFRLLHQLYEHALIAPIRDRCADGVPYIGWSAGANVCGLSIRTTNDMPIVEPPSFEALALIDAQINPHYTDYVPPDHHGETRDERLAEFMALDPATPVFAIREGSALRLEGRTLTIVGSGTNYCFVGATKRPLAPGQVLNPLLPSR